MTRRTALCLECRTALTAGETCDLHPRARALDLADPAQRGRAVDRIWGPPHLRVRGVAKAGGAGGTAGGLFEGCSGCDLGNLSLDGEAALALVVILVAAIAAVALYYLVKYVVFRIRAYRARPRPVGSRPRWVRGHRSLRGRVRDAVGTTAPLSGTACAAWGITLEHDRATVGPHMLGDAATAGLTIELSDGRTVTVPAGRVRVHGDGRREDVSADYLRSIDAEHRDDDPVPVFPFDRAREVCIIVGDAVDLTGGIEERFDPEAPAGYREAAATRLVAHGVVTLSRAQE